MTSRRARLVRAALAAGLTTFVAALSHSLAGAESPGSLAVVLSLTFSLLVCIALTGKQLSAWRLSIAVVASQFVYHSLFTLFGGDAGWSGSGVALGAHDHMGASAGQLMVPGGVAASGHGSAVAMGAMAGHDGGWMLAAHAAAAALTIVALRDGERAFWGLVDGTRLYVRALFASFATLPVFERALIRVADGRDAAFPRDLDVLVSSIRHRGPPLAQTAR